MIAILPLWTLMTHLQWLNNLLMLTVFMATLVHCGHIDTTVLGLNTHFSPAHIAITLDVIAWILIQLEYAAQTHSVCWNMSNAFTITLFLLSASGSSCIDGQLQLVGGQTSNEGRLEYCNQGQWSPFCNLGDEEATVACKQLGHTVYPCEYC